MHKDAFVFDNVVHMYDNTEANLAPEGQRVAHNIAKGLSGIAGFSEQEWVTARIGVDEALSYLFEQSDTDMAMAQTVPLFGYWVDGLAPARLQYELKEAAPDRIVFCGGVDPVYQGVEGAVREMRRQVEEWGAVSMKFYKAHANRLSWRADDTRIAYPLYETALDLGLTNVQFHCGLPFGQEYVDDLRPNDIQGPAHDFPELTFVIHHLGEPYSDETISLATRFENVWLSLSSVFINRWPLAPYDVYHRYGRVLRAVGADRLLWGSEAFIWPSIQGLIEHFAEVQIPEELQDRYGYPELTWDMKKRIFGANQARLLGIDLEARLAGTEPSP
jgi:uncharacterized protein